MLGTLLSGQRTFATWNPADMGDIVLSAGDLTATGDSGFAQVARSTIGKASGRWYWEARMGAGGAPEVGVSLANFNPNNTSLGQQASGWAYMSQAGNKRNSNTQTSYGAAYAVNDVIGVALDMVGGKLWFSKNGVWQASGDPAAGTNEAFNGLSGTVYATISVLGGEILTARFRHTSLTFAPPTGFNPGLFR